MLEARKFLGVNFLPYKMKTEKELDAEVREAFDRAIDAIMFDYMYMGTEKGDDLEYMMFKHIETREYIKIPKCGVAFHETV